LRAARVQAHDLWATAARYLADDAQYRIGKRAEVRTAQETALMRFKMRQAEDRRDVRFEIKKGSRSAAALSALVTRQETALAAFVRAQERYLQTSRALFKRNRLLLKTFCIFFKRRERLLVRAHTRAEAPAPEKKARPVKAQVIKDQLAKHAALTAQRLAENAEERTARRAALRVQQANEVAQLKAAQKQELDVGLADFKPSERSMILQYKETVLPDHEAQLESLRAAHETQLEEFNVQERAMEQQLKARLERAAEERFTSEEVS
jgi:hypothetical protein